MKVLDYALGDGMTTTKNELRDIDKPFYRYWQALYHSFFNSRLYVDVAKRWKGYGLIYFLLLMFVVTIPFALRATIDFNRFFNENLIAPLANLPPLFIQNGQISFDKPMPYFIKNTEGQIVSIVDTTGAITKIDKQFPYLSTLIMKDKMLYRLSTPQLFFTNPNENNIENPVYAYSFSKESNAVFDGKNWIKISGINNLKYVFGFLIYPTLALIYFAIFAVLFLAFALMGQFIARYMFKFNISYKVASRLGFVSVTPAMFVLWFCLTLNLVFQGIGMLVLAIFTLYFCYAVISLKRESNKLVTK